MQPINYVKVNCERGENMSLGQRLMKLRKEKHLSQEEVADQLNVTRQSVSKWETDQSTPDFDKILPICELFGITTEKLITGEKKIINNKDDKSEIIYDTKENKQKRIGGLAIGILLYFVAVTWIVSSIAAFKVNPLIATNALSNNSSHESLSIPSISKDFNSSFTSINLWISIVLNPISPKKVLI